MKLSLLITLFLTVLMCSTAQAQLRKCTGRDGRVTYSDAACPERTQSERPVETGGNTLDASALREKVQKDKVQAEQAEASARERAALEARVHQQAQALAAETARQNADKDAAAYAACVREVERQSPSEDVKAELFAACRTAGASQRQTGMTEAALRECIQNVERTRVFGSDKARQLATCHGADVKPEPVVVVVPAMRLRPARLTGCDATRCVDDRGRRYTRQGAALRRDDAAVCQAVGNKVQCH